MNEQRGKIDLSAHKLAGLYRAPARPSKHRRKRMPKMPGGTHGAYWMLWRIVDGAVRDTFERHPDYLSDKGRYSAQLSITKRVVGALYSYGSQVRRTENETQCRSVQMDATWLDEADALPTFLAAGADAAADKEADSYGFNFHASALLGTLAKRVRLEPARVWRLVTAATKFKGDSSNA